MIFSNVLILSVCIAAPLLILGIVFIVIALNMRRKAAASRGWPTTPGVVTSATVDEAVSSDADTPSGSFQPKVVYSYQVGGVNYQSQRLSFGAVRSGSRGYAEKALEAYPTGKAVVVHYNPEKPSDAVLGVEAGGANIFLIVGIVLAVIGVIVGCVGLAIALFAVASSTTS